tara:strand:- start:201 stop:956 length:756 start_codon:yes stop_codon:yes gene_type:complete
MGLKTSGDQENQSVTFLAVAGGYIWDKSKGADDPNYKTQEYAKLEGEVGVRQGARYDSLNGSVIGVEFQEHDQYGESIRVKIESGGEHFIVSIGTNNRYSQDMMKVLLKMDFSKPVLIKPYDFTDKVKNKRVQGISFKQDGEKIALRNDDAPFADSKFFATATQKKKKRFFEDLTEWFVDAVKAEIIPVHFPSSGENSETPTPKAKAPVAKAPVAKAPVAKAKAPVAKAKAPAASVPAEDLGSALDALLED